jgi:hypothetical protein
MVPGLAALTFLFLLPGTVLISESIRNLKAFISGYFLNFKNCDVLSYF